MLLRKWLLSIVSHALQGSCLAVVSVAKLFLSEKKNNLCVYVLKAD